MDAIAKRLRVSMMDLLSQKKQPKQTPTLALVMTDVNARIAEGVCLREVTTGYQ